MQNSIYRKLKKKKQKKSEPLTNLSCGEVVETKPVPDLIFTGSTRLVDLVAQHQDGSIGHLLICQQALQQAATHH